MSRYLVWKVECVACGWDECFGEDEGSIPDQCPSCGVADWWKEDEDDR